MLTSTFHWMRMEKITDDTRIRGALPTLKKNFERWRFCYHHVSYGQTEGKVNAKMSLSQIVDAVSDKLGVKSSILQ